MKHVYRHECVAVHVSECQRSSGGLKPFQYTQLLQHGHRTKLGICCVVAVRMALGSVLADTPTCMLPVGMWALQHPTCDMVAAALQGLSSLGGYLLGFWMGLKLL